MDCAAVDGSRERKVGRWRAIKREGGVIEKEEEYARAKNTRGVAAQDLSGVMYLLSSAKIYTKKVQMEMCAWRPFPRRKNQLRLPTTKTR